MTMTTAQPHDITAPAVTTRALLLAGAVAGPLFLGTVGIQMLTHDDFDPRLHPLSSLSLGAQGWIQIANFVVTGLLVLAFAAGLRRALHPGRAGTWGPILVGVNGVSLIVAAVFLADPVNGYPAGAADEVTAHGIVHSTAPALAGLAGLAGYLVFARRFAGLGRRGWTVVCLAVGPIDLALSGTAATVGDFRLMLLGAAVGWGWTSLLAVHLLRGRAGARMP